MLYFAYAGDEVERQEDDVDEGEVLQQGVDVICLLAPA